MRKIGFGFACGAINLLFRMTAEGNAGDVQTCLDFEKVSQLSSKGEMTLLDFPHRFKGHREMVHLDGNDWVPKELRLTHLF